LRIFVTGANGYIGGSVAAALAADGHRVRGLVRDRAKAEAVVPHGIEPVIGTLDAAELLRAEARAADAVINAASSDHAGAIETLIEGLSGSNKPLIHSSGSSIVADLALGEPSERVFDETAPVDPVPDKAARVAIDRRVLAAPGIRSVVLCNSMIYGPALGPPAASVQIPALAHHARATGTARYVGRGLNRWSNVHIADVVALYRVALARAPAGAFMYVESGEEQLAAIADAIGAKLGLGPAQSITPEDAIAAWGRNMAVYSLGSNSRVRGTAGAALGWRPQHRSITSWIARELA
jgi:nucleoside-diphosphate-sugar epimerase